MTVPANDFVAPPASRIVAALDVVEIALTIGIGYGCHLYYNLVGHMASLRGIDHGPSLVTLLDRAVPFLPLLAPFYAVAYFAPLLVLALILPRIGRDAPAYRRIILSFLALLAVHFAIYLLWPTSAKAVRIEDAQIGTGPFAAIVRSQYRLATAWCAWPSLHVSACWFFYRVLARYRPLASRFTLVWFVGMFVGTFGIKIHFIADGVAGFLLSEGAYRFVLLPLDRTGALRLPTVPRAVRFAILGLALGLIGTGLPVLMRVTGFTGPLYVIKP